MTDRTTPAGHVLGSLESVDGKGVVRLAGRFDTDVSDLWSAITDPRRLAHWHARVVGDLRPGGTFQIRLEADDWEGTGRVEVCDAPTHLLVTTRESDASWRKGEGVPPFDETIEVTLRADGDQTVLAAEVRGVPLEPLAFYGVGWQIHLENLGAYLEGRARADVEARWEELLPGFQALAADIG